MTTNHKIAVINFGQKLLFLFIKFYNGYVSYLEEVKSEYEASKRVYQK